MEEKETSAPFSSLWERVACAHGTDAETVVREIARAALCGEKSMCLAEIQGSADDENGREEAVARVLVTRAVRAFLHNQENGVF